jgi:hypothetical protein
VRTVLFVCVEFFLAGRRANAPLSVSVAMAALAFSLGQLDRECQVSPLVAEGPRTEHAEASIAIVPAAKPSGARKQTSKQKQNRSNKQRGNFGGNSTWHAVV